MILQAPLTRAAPAAQAEGEQFTRQEAAMRAALAILALLTLAACGGGVPIVPII
jgi:hypothetical protein